MSTLVLKFGGTSVATTKLNPIAYHRALIREAIHDRNKSSLP